MVCSPQGTIHPSFGAFSRLFVAPFKLLWRLLSGSRSMPYIYWADTGLRRPHTADVGIPAWNQLEVTSMPPLYSTQYGRGAGCLIANPYTSTCNLIPCVPPYMRGPEVLKDCLVVVVIPER